MSTTTPSQSAESSETLSFAGVSITTDNTVVLEGQVHIKHPDDPDVIQPLMIGTYTFIQNVQCDVIDGLIAIEGHPRNKWAKATLDENGEIVLAHLYCDRRDVGSLPWQYYDVF